MRENLSKVIREDSSEVVEAYVTKSGNFHWLNLSATELASRQIKSKFEYFEKYERPPYSFSDLSSLSEVSIYHSRCVKAKAGDVAVGFSIVPAEGEENPDEKNKERLEIFFEFSEGQCDTFIDILEKALIDMEFFGIGYIEIARNLAGDPAAMWHILSSSVKVGRGGKGFYQIFGISSMFFQQFPQKCVRKNGLPVWSLLDSKGIAIPDLSVFNSANELLVFKLYHPNSKYYGLPDHVPAIGAMASNLAVEDYNFQLLRGEGLPAYAVIAEGGRINKTDHPLIESYFKTAKAKGASNVLVLSVPGKDVRINVKKLDSTPNTNFMASIKKEARTDVLVAHGVPPVRLGLMEGEGLGGARELIQLDAYKAGTIAPRRKKVAYIFNEIVVKQAFGIFDWQVVFEGADIRDRKTECDVNTSYLKDGVLEVDEVRSYLGLEPKEVEPLPVPLEKTRTASQDYELGAMIELQEDEKVVGERLLKASRSDVSQNLYAVWEGSIPTFTPGMDVDVFVGEIRKALNYVVDSRLGELIRISSKRLKMFGFTLSDDEIMDLLQSDMVVKYHKFLDEAWLKDCRNHLYGITKASEKARPLLMTMAENQMKGRSHLYGGIFNYGVNSVVKHCAEAEDLSIFWALASKEPCKDCLALAEGSPYSPGTLKNTPGDGATVCRGNCQCFLVPVRK